MAIRATPNSDDHARRDDLRDLLIPRREAFGHHGDGEIEPQPRHGGGADEGQPDHAIDGRFIDPVDREVRIAGDDVHQDQGRQQIHQPHQGDALESEQEARSPDNDPPGAERRRIRNRLLDHERAPLPVEIYRALQKCIIYTILSNGDSGQNPPLLLLLGREPRQRAKLGPPRSERPAMTTEDQMKGPLKHRTCRLRSSTSSGSRFSTGPIRPARSCGRTRWAMPTA